MSDNDLSAADPFGQIADEFVEAFRQGKRPSVEEFARRYPAHADEIRDMLPALLLMEKAKTNDDSSGQPHLTPAATVAPSLRHLGDYQILREVGRGGMGVVYEAQQLSLGRHVAIKVLPAHALLDGRHLGRFQREARSAAKLHHTNIVPVFGVGEQDGLHYYVMQFIHGLGLDVVLSELRRLRHPRGTAALTKDDAPGQPTNLRRDASAVDVARALLTGQFRQADEAGALTTAPGEVSPAASAPAAPSSVGVSDTSAAIRLPGQSGGSSLSESGNQYWQSVARVGMQVADALAHAASQGVLHRDIKPSNLLLDDTGNVWVTDFGLAKAVSDTENLTHTGDIVGTLRYMAPERFEGQGDLRSDVYSLGLTLYEMLALRPAFGEVDQNKLIKQVMHDEPARPRKLNPSVPRDLETVVLKAIARDPAHRYQTPAEMAEDLKRFVEDRPVRARRISTSEQFWRWCRRNPLPASLLLGIVLVFVIGFAGVFLQWREAAAARDDEKSQRDRTEQSRQETADALAVVESQKAVVESQKAAVESSLSKAEKAEQVARAAEEAGRKLLYTTDMRLAPFLWKDDRTTAEQLRALLAKHIPAGALGAGLLTPPDAEKKPDLRGFEWHYYQHLLERSATVFAGHGVSVIGGAFTANGQLVTLGQNGQVRRWDASSQSEDKASRRDLPGGSSAQVRVLSPDGRLAALAEGNKVHVVDTATGKEKFQIDSANNSTRHLIFSRDGDRLVVVDGKIRWLSAVNGAALASVNQYFQRISSLALSADGLTLAVVGHGTSGRRFSIYRLDAAKRTVTPAAKDVVSGGTVNASALSADGQRIAVGSMLSLGLSVCDTATGRAIANVGTAHASPIAAAAFSSDGSRLATADTQGTIKIWADAGKLNSKSTALLTLKGHHGAIQSVAYSSDGKRLVSTSVDKTARVWDLENAGAAIRRLERSGGQCYVARFSPDGQRIAVAAGSILQLWDGATGQLVRQLSAGDRSRIYSVAFSPADDRLLAVGYGAQAFSGQTGISHVALWDIDAGTELARLPGATDLPGADVSEYNGAIAALAFSPDGKYLAAGFGTKFYFDSTAYPNPLKVWEVGTRRLVRRLNGHTGHCVSLDFSRDGTLLASGSRDGTAILWSTSTWKATHRLQNPDRGRDNESQAGRSFVDDVAFSPDGKTLALASRAGNVQLWDVASGKLLVTLKGHSGAVQAVVFSPDGRSLASGSGDETVRLWNVATRRELMQLDAGSVVLGNVVSLAFSSDGKHLLAGGFGGAVFWSAAPIVWNDAGRAAAKLRLLLESNADFQGRIRMLSENLRLHEALAKLDTKDLRVRAALAATRANWHASQKRWVEAAKEIDRLLAADPTSPAAWLRTPGLLRLATALVHQNRPAVAAMLLQAGEKLRSQDPANARLTGIGIGVGTEEGVVRLKMLVPNSAASRSKLLVGDAVVKVDGVDVTKRAISDIHRMLGGKVGTKHRLMVRHPGKTQTEDFDLAIENFRVDAATAELVSALLAALEKRLAKNPKDAGLLELRAELAGEESDFARQAADCTAAIDALSQQTPKAAAVHLQRLYGRRGNAYLGLKQWQKATDDYARAVTDKTTDEALLSNQALAQAEVMLPSPKWTVLKPVEAKSELGATLSLLPDDSILAGGANPPKDRYRVVLTVPKKIDLTAVRLQALTHPSLPKNGPGRNPVGAFAQVSWKVTARSPNRKDPLTLEFDRVWADHQIPGFPMTSSGHWNTSQSGEGRNCTAVWSMSKPVSLTAGTTLTFEMQFKEWNGQRENLGHFRLSVSGDPAALNKARNLFAVSNLTDPWQKLAAVYQLKGDQRAIDQLVARRPKLAGKIGDLFTQGTDKGKDWQRAVEIYSRGITKETTDAELLSKRARAYEGLKKWDAAAADWSRAATDNPDGAKLLAEFARRLSAAGQLPLANELFDKAQALYERSLAADPENDALATELAELLLNKHENGKSTPWTVLQPTKMKSEGGATLTLQPDGSVLASGVSPDRDVYSLFAKTDLKRITAIRLEALPDPSMPHNGPGRSPIDGNFHLNKLRFFSGGQPCPLTNIVVVHANVLNGASSPFETVIKGELDDKPGWGNFPRAGKANTAVISTSVARQPDDDLKVEMYFARSNWKQSNLGRFRLSVSDDPAAVEKEENRFAVLRITDPITDPWLKLAAGYALNSRNEEALPYFSRAFQRADGYEARKSIVDLAARFVEIVAALSKRQPDDPQLQLALARSLAERGKQRLAEKRPSQAQADLEKSREILAGLRAKHAELWSVLTPTELKSQGGETLTVEKDGSIFVSGPNPERAVYTLKMRTDLPTLKAIRLDAIPDARLPDRGSGRFGNGNFHLAELTATLISSKEGKTTPIVFSSAMADEQQVQTGFDASTILDGNPRTYWDTYPRMQQPHWVVFVLRTPIRTDGGYLSITLDSGISMWYQHGLGRFRLSATNDADLTRALVRSDLKDGEVVDLCIALAKAHGQQGRLNEAGLLLTEAFDLAADRAAKAKIIAEAAPLQGVAEKLAERAPDDAQFQAELARHFAERGNAAAADAARAKACALFAEKLTKEPESTALAADLFSAYQSAGRTREAVPYLAKASAANLKDTAFSLKVAALQAWFGQEKEFAATRKRILAFANDTTNWETCERGAKACSILPYTDKAELEAVRSLARKGVGLGEGGRWPQLALGMVEYRSGNYTAANEAMLAAVKVKPDNRIVTGISGFYRAMILFQQGKTDEARKLAIATTAKMKPLPEDENNPLADGAYWDDLILWLAYKEAKTMIRFDAAPLPEATPKQK